MLQSTIIANKESDMQEHKTLLFNNWDVFTWFS